MNLKKTKIGIIGLGFVGTAIRESLDQVIFFIYSRQLITSKTMLISLILLLTISLIVSKDYNSDKILIKRFSEKKLSKGNIFSKDTELKIDNRNCYSLINNSLK